jgi:uncharacterized protein YkwD
MARRPAPRATLKLERLEVREVLSSGGPTGEVQALLELTNFARQHPAEAANWAGSDLQTDNLGLTLQTFNVNLGQARGDIASKAVAQPLAWNASLAQAASVQSEYMAETGQQTHTGGGTLADGTVVGVTGDDRIFNAGYRNRTVSGENAFAYANSVDNAMNAFLLDWGNDPAVKPHLTNIFRPDYTEVGIGIVNTSGKGVGPKVITQDFASRSDFKPMLLGVAYNDSVKPDHFYQAGEGVGDVSIDVTDSAGHTQTIQTWDAGGYQIALDPGNYTVTARVGNQVVRSQAVTIGTQNVKVDFDLADPWAGTTIAPPAAVPAPVVIPAPAPVVVTPPPPVVVPVVVTPPAPVVAPVVATPPAPMVAPVTLQVSAPVVVTPVTPVAVPVPAVTVDVKTKDALTSLDFSSDIMWQSW